MPPKIDAGAGNGNGISGFKVNPLTDSNDSVCSRTDTQRGRVQPEVGARSDATRPSSNGAGLTVSNARTCGRGAHCLATRDARKLFKCNACRKQTSARAGTIFAASKLPLLLWFSAMYQLTQTKQGISSLELARRLGITQNAAWKMKHKLAQVMLERSAAKRPEGQGADGRRLSRRRTFGAERARREG